MTETQYVLHVNGVERHRTPEEVEAGLRLLDSFMEPQAITNEVTLESTGPDWFDYIDLGLKALLVIAAFAIYARL